MINDRQLHVLLLRYNSIIIKLQIYDEEGSNRGFSKQRFPYSYDRVYNNKEDQVGASVIKSERFSVKPQANDRSWSWSNLSNFLLKSINWGHVGQQIDQHFEISNRQLDIGLFPVSILFIIFQIMHSNLLNLIVFNGIH